MSIRFTPRGGRYGIAPVIIGSGPIGGANMIGGAAPLTVNATTKFYLPSPYRNCYVTRFSAVALTVPVDADGTILARLGKYDASADAEVILSQDINLEALVTREVAFADMITSLTMAQKLLDVGDSLYVAVVNNSAAIDTQPAQLTFAVEMAMKN